MPAVGPLVKRPSCRAAGLLRREPGLRRILIVGGTRSNPQELDYPETGGTEQKNTTYTGKGGVPVGSFFNRLLYAAKYSEKNFLLSGASTTTPRSSTCRNPRERVEKVAPFLTLDGDPYPAIVDGRILWILDGYTTSNEYPYSQSESLGDMTRDTRHRPAAWSPSSRRTRSTTSATRSRPPSTPTTAPSPCTPGTTRTRC